MPAPPTYQKLAFQGRVTGVMRLADTTSFLVPEDGEDDARYRENGDYLRYLADMAAGAVVSDPDPEPESPPTRVERQTTALAQAKAHIEAAPDLAPATRAALAGALEIIVNGLGG